MPVRDRLAELQKGLKKSDKVDDSKAKGDSNGQLNTFLKKVEAVDNKIKDVRARLDDLQKQQQNIICSPGYDTDVVSELQKNTNSIRGELASVQKDIRELEHVRESDKNADGDSALARIRSQQVTRLVSSLSSLSNDYFHLQAVYSGKMKQKLNRQHNIVQGITDDRLTLTESETNEMLENHTSIFTQDFVSNVEEAQAALNEIEERHKDITKLEKSVTEVNVLFQEMSMLVTDQGEKIDNIEANIDSANVLIQDGNTELGKANEHRRKSRRCCIIIAVVITIAVAIVVAIILSQVL